jgi:hypothetical protein
MYFEDNEGNFLLQSDIDELAPWQIEERGIHVWVDKIDDRW